MHSFDHDKELDQLTKAAAEAIEAPSSANWDKMQRTLDKELPQQKKRRGGFIWWIVPCILALVLGTYWLQSTQKQSILKEAVQKEDPKNPFLKQLNTQPLEAVKKENTINSVKTINSKNINQENKINIAFSPSNTQTQLNNTNHTIAIEPNNVIAESNTEVNTNNSTIINNPILEAVDSKVDSNKMVVFNTNKTNKIVSVPSKKGFFMGLIGGFDASTVKYNYASNVGYNLGVGIGYRFNNHLSVQTGAIYTQKNYKLKGQDFHPPKGSWISNYEIETVDGYCKMWDVPIFATYHFTGNENGNTFISVGTSSYFMKQENYNYLYLYNNQYYNRTSNYNSNDQHLFALLHISAGIERPIGKNITSIIEPYAKIPLKGVGLGSIQLSSFGLNFSVQYRQPKK
jgi:hypothetical protein